MYNKRTVPTDHSNQVGNWILNNKKVKECFVMQYFIHVEVI